MWAITFAAFCAVPVAFFQLCLRGVDRWTGAPTGRGRAGRARRGRPKPNQCERYSRDLRRLAADHDRVLRADVPAKAARLRALELAYDDTLAYACRALELDAPATPFTAITRVQVEADLVTHGLTW